MKRPVSLSPLEAERVGGIQAVVEGRLKQVEAAERLGLTARQVRRLVGRYEEGGAAGLASRRRGRTPGHRIAAECKAAIWARLEERYVDFPPRLAWEKWRAEGDEVSEETVRRRMVAAGFWQAKRPRRLPVHQTRERRARVGELVPIDGSPHAWLEERGERSSLIAFVEDATSLLLAARFWPTETTEAYLGTLREYWERHGRPVALDSDRHSIFRVNQPDQEGAVTQFTRALQDLDIQPIHAHSPQAKGRVERAYRTLQARLPRELRLRGIASEEAAHACLPQYVAESNRRFGQAPREAADAHRELAFREEELDLILGPQPERKLSKNLTFKFKNGEYGLVGQGRGSRWQGTTVTVCERYAAPLAVLREGRELQGRKLAERAAPIPVDDEKSVTGTVDRALARQGAGRPPKPKANPPWRRQAQAAAKLAAARRGGSG